jgi:hypothetical protein
MMEASSVERMYGMKAISIARAWNDIDRCYFAYSDEADELGLDPFRLLDDMIDASRDLSVYWIGGQEVSPNYVIYYKAA